MTIPIEFLVYGGIAVYFIIGFFVGRRIFRLAMNDDFINDTVMSCFIALLATFLWPVVVVGYILCFLQRW